MNMTIRIDQEFQRYIHPLIATEQEALENSLSFEGCRDALVVWKEEGILIDGHHRKAICDARGIDYRIVELSFPDRSAAFVWMIDNQLSRRNITPITRVELIRHKREILIEKARERQSSGQGGVLLPGNFPEGNKGEVRDQLGEEAGIGGQTFEALETVLDKGVEELIDSVRSGRLGASTAAEVARLPEDEQRELCGIDGKKALVEAAKAAKAERIAEDRKRKIEEERAAIAKKGKEIEFDNRWKVEAADIATYQTANKFDYIITDPPYPREHLELYTVLAERALEWLKPGGLLLAMCGQSYLDQIIDGMKKHLEYYWTGCYLLPGQPTPLRQRQVNTSWKPILVFGLPGDEYKGKIFGDVWRSDGNDKDFHKWGQSISGMYSIIKQVCLPGQRILDPFCGAGTTGIAALKHGCLFNGIDIEQENADISSARLAEVSHDAQTE